MDRKFFATLALAPTAAVLVACGPQAGDATTAARHATAASRTSAVRAVVPRGDLGTVTAVVALRSAAPTTGAGAVIGGVLGAAVGNQIGGGDGRKAATVIGAVGGAAVGNQIEKDRRTQVTGYRVDVRLDDGRTVSVTLSQADGFTSGQRVRVVDGTVRPA